MRDIRPTRTTPPQQRTRWVSILICGALTVASLAATPLVRTPNADEGSGAASAGQVTIAERTTSPAEDGRVVERLYLEMPYGVELAATLVRPDDPGGQHPVLMLYDPYGSGSNSEAAFGVPGPDFFIPHGYAFLQVSVRGTGCSSGAFDQVFSPIEAQDGARVVEWAASQPWSNGRVGLLGSSYSGIDQFFVAAEHPDGLAAIAPFATLGDLYRDVAYPGGIHNVVFTAAWSLALQPDYSIGTASAEIQAGDERCAANQADHVENPLARMATRALQYPLDDEYWYDRSPRRVVDQIDVPVFMAQAWQDNQVGDRAIALYDDIRTPKKLTVMNGKHDTARRAPFVRDQLLRWFDRWLKDDVDNGIMEEEPVTVLLDVRGAPCSFLGCPVPPEPTGVLRGEQWPLADTTFTSVFLRADNRLSFDPPTTAEPGDSYVTPSDRTMRSWETSLPYDDQGSALSYTSDPFTDDRIVVGPAEFDLYASATGVDTDWFVAVSEIGEDGSRTLIQRGLLRASHRAVDESRSSPGMPFHPHRDPQPVTPGETLRYRVELLPFGHVFRAGTRLRLDFYAPSPATELNAGSMWGYVPYPVPSLNTVQHGPETPSRLVLPMMDAPESLGDWPGCGQLEALICIPPEE